MMEAVYVATNTDNKGNNVLMHGILAHTRIRSTSNIFGFTQMSELVFEISFIVKMM